MTTRRLGLAAAGLLAGMALHDAMDTQPQRYVDPHRAANEQELRRKKLEKLRGNALASAHKAATAVEQTFQAMAKATHKNSLQASANASAIFDAYEGPAVGMPIIDHSNNTQAFQNSNYQSDRPLPNVRFAMADESLLHPDELRWKEALQSAVECHKKARSQTLNSEETKKYVKKCLADQKLTQDIELRMRALRMPQAPSFLQ